jgi:WD40 repeat protein
MHALSEVVYDARRLIMYHKEMIREYPLQVYGSALFFSPADSLIRRLFQHEEPRGVAIKPDISNDWSTFTQTLETHTGFVRYVAFSYDSAKLASASEDYTAKIWDTHSGVCLQTLEGHSDCVISVVFSHDSARLALASASFDKTVKIWDAHSGACLHTLKGHIYYVSSVDFSHDSAMVASGSGDSTVKIWDAHSGLCLHTLEGHSNDVSAVAFSHGSRLASASFDSTIKIWDAHSGTCLQTIETYSNDISSIAYSLDSARLGSVSGYSTATVWDAHSGACLQTLEGQGDSDLPSVLATPPCNKDADESQQSPHHDSSISMDTEWIRINSQNTLYLSSEYTPSCAAVSNKFIGVGTGHGRVWIARVE